MSSEYPKEQALVSLVRLGRPGWIGRGMGYNTYSSVRCDFLLKIGTLSVKIIKQIPLSLGISSTFG